MITNLAKIIGSYEILGFKKYVLFLINVVNSNFCFFTRMFGGVSTDTPGWKEASTCAV